MRITMCRSVPRQSPRFLEGSALTPPCRTGTRFAFHRGVTQTTYRFGFVVLFLGAACGGVTASDPAIDASVDTSIGVVDGSSALDAGALRDAADSQTDTDASDDAALDAGADAPTDAAFDNDPRCPPTFGSTGECTIDGVECRYPQGRCDCARPCSGVFIPDASWSCTAFTAACPDDPPVKGSACVSAGAHCTYPGCCTVNDFTCAAGQWDAAPPFCPP